MGMEPHRLKNQERRAFADALSKLDNYELSVLWSLLSLLAKDEDISDLNGVPILLDKLTKDSSV